MIAFFLIIFFLPESLPKEIRLNGKRGRAPQAREMWEALYSPIGILLLVAFLLSFSLTNMETVFGLFTLERFGFDAGQVGIVLMAAGVIYAIVPAVFMGPLTNRFGDLSVMRGALWANAIGLCSHAITREHDRHSCRGHGDGRGECSASACDHLDDLEAH